MTLALVLALSPVPVQSALSQGLPPTPAEAGALPRSPSPLNNPGTWVTPADYPPAALRANVEGVTEFLLTIGPDGRVSDCRIMASSGSSDLDRTTCDLVQARSRFAPARDAGGTAVIGAYRNRVRWTIPRAPAPAGGEMVISFLVAPDGTRSDCRVETATGGALAMTAQASPCQAFPGRRYSSGYRDAAGQPVTRRIRMTSRVEVLPEK